MELDKLTSKELEILLILWNYGSTTVKTINEEQNKIDVVGYTTTLKIMQLMFDKGILSRETKGKGHVYSSTISEDKIQQFLFKKYTKTTSGKSAMKLVLKALGNLEESEDDLLEIKNYLNNL
jgi:predicted transcriptional regulator